MNFTKSRLCVPTLGFVLILSLAISPAWGQAFVSGEITGAVTDSTGAVVPGSTVRATNAGTNISTETLTNDAGLYRISSLIPGTYLLSVEQPGFKKFVRENIVVSVGTVVRVDATLEVGAPTESVTVTGAAPMLKADAADVSQTIGRRQVADLPTLGRNITRLVQLVPGAVMAPGQLSGWPENAGDDFRTNINGQNSNNSNRQLDGVDNNETIQGLSMIVPALDSVEEMKVTTSNYDAEFGQVAGAVIQISTRSGTNEFHGSLFEFYRSSGMFARNPFTEPIGPAKFIWQQFGGSAGGPIVKDKVFFFGDYQGVRALNGASTLTTVPVAAFRNGDFSSVAATNPIFDPATGNPDGTGRTAFPNNIIPSTRISSPAAKLMALLPSPTNPALLNNNFTKSGGGLFDQNQFNARTDYNMSSKSKLFGRFSLFRSKDDVPGAFGDVLGGTPLGGAVASGFRGSQSQSWVASYTRILSTSLLTDLRFGFSRVSMHSTTRNAQLRTADEVGIPGINTGIETTNGIPTMSIAGPTGGVTFGQNLPFYEWVTNVSVTNSWTKEAGRHSFKWGADIKKAYARRQDSSGRGIMSFPQSVTGSATVAGSGLGMATFLLGLPSSYTRLITLDLKQEQQWRPGLYFQDRWTVTPKLTLTLGLRWEYYSPIFSNGPGNLSNLDTTTGEAIVAGIGDIDKYAEVEPVYTEWAPRVGLAYRLGKNTVIRAAFGRGYAINGVGANFGRMYRNWPIQQNQEISAATSFTSAFTLAQGPPPAAAIPPIPSSGRLPLPVGVPYLYPGPGPYPHSYVDSWNLTIQRQLRGTTLEVAYLGNVGRRLWMDRNSNAPVPGPGPLNPNRPFFNRFGWTQSLNLHRAQGRSKYHSLQAKVEKSFSHGFLVLSSFTWAKGLDEGINGFQNIFNFHSNSGPSDQTRNLISMTSFLWELPFGPGKPLGSQLKGVARHLVQGWAINGIVGLQSGMWFTPTYSDTSAYNSNCCTLRPDRIGSGKISDPSKDKWFDPSAFTRPPAYTYGNSGRNILTGPGWANSDLSLFKQFRFAETANLELRWEAFNAFNRANLTNPNAAVNTATAGRITGILYTMRRMQIGARLSW